MVNFEPGYIGQLIEFGEQDTQARMGGPGLPAGLILPVQPHQTVNVVSRCPWAISEHAAGLR